MKKLLLNLILASAFIIGINADADYLTYVYDNYSLFEGSEEPTIDSPLYDYELQYTDTSGVNLKVNFFCFIGSKSSLERENDIISFNCNATSGHTIQILKNGTMLSSFVPKAEEKVYFNLPDYRMWIHSESTVESDRLNVRVILVPVEASAYVFDTSTKRVYLTASFPVVYKDLPVSVILKDKYSESSSVEISDIGYFEQSVINASGDFAVDFKFAKDVSLYKAVVNAAGLKYEIEEPQIIDSGQEPEIRLDFTQENNSVNARLTVNDAFRGKHDTCSMFVAFYDEKDSLVSVSKSNNFSLELTAAIPQNAKSAKAFVWEDFTRLIPYCGHINLELTQ